jgi:inorganic pyrophosphatase
VPTGSRNKYEFDHRTGVIRLDRQLFTAAHYPVDYGFIPGTLARDGDPLDALVVVDEPTFPGCHIECRAVGLLSVSDQQGIDAKVLAVAAADPRHGWKDIGDVPEYVRLEISHFFRMYKELEPGRWSDVRGWRNRAAATREIARCRRRAERQPMGETGAPLHPPAGNGARAGAAKRGRARLHR